MSQQINLLSAELKKPKEWLTSVFALKCLGGLLVLLVALAGNTFWQTQRLEKEHANWNLQSDEARNGLTQATQQFPARQPDPALQVEIAALEEKLKTRDQVLEKLNSGAFSKTGGFSPILEAFARQTLNGLWLTGISLNGAGDEMRISGRALSADLIPQYITRMSAEPALRGRRFTTFQVGQPKPVAPPAGQGGTAAAVAGPSYVEFTLSADKVAEPVVATAKVPQEAKR